MFGVMPGTLWYVPSASALLPMKTFNPPWDEIRIGSVRYLFFDAAR